VPSRPDAGAMSVENECDEIEPGPAAVVPGCDRPTGYQIRVRGELDTGWSDWFAGVRVAVEGGDTVLVGRMDQATLYGALRRVRDLGLPLICVSPSEDP